jgi:20S proteasome subunit beta 7
MIGASGDMADFQQVKHMLQGLMSVHFPPTNSSQDTTDQGRMFARACRTDEIITEDGHELSTSQIFEYLSNVMYARRNKFDPYWNALLVAGVENGEPCVPPAPL